MSDRPYSMYRTDRHKPNFLSLKFHFYNSVATHKTVQRSFTAGL